MSPDVIDAFARAILADESSLPTLLYRPTRQPSRVLPSFDLSINATLDRESDAVFPSRARADPALLRHSRRPVPCPSVRRIVSTQSVDLDPVANNCIARSRHRRRAGQCRRVHSVERRNRLEPFAEKAVECPFAIARDDVRRDPHLANVTAEMTLSDECRDGHLQRRGQCQSSAFLAATKVRIAQSARR